MKLIVNINLRVCYVAQVYVDTDGNVLQKAISTVNTVESGIFISRGRVVAFYLDTSRTFTQRFIFVR